MLERDKNRKMEKECVFLLLIQFCFFLCHWVQFPFKIFNITVFILTTMAINYSERLISTARINLSSHCIYFCLWNKLNWEIRKKIFTSLKLFHMNSKHLPLCWRKQYFHRLRIICCKHHLFNIIGLYTLHHTNQSFTSSKYDRLH